MHHFSIKRCRIWIVSIQILRLELAATGIYFTSTSACTRLKEISRDEASLMNTSSQVRWHQCQKRRPAFPPPLASHSWPSTRLSFELLQLCILQAVREMRLGEDRAASSTHTAGATSRSAGLAADSGASWVGYVGKPEGSPQRLKNANFWRASLGEILWNLVNVTSFL